MSSQMERDIDAGLARARKLEAAELIPEDQRFQYSPLDLRLGGFVRFEDRVWRVEERSSYQWASEDYSEYFEEPWYELKLVAVEDGEVLWLELEEDDRLQAWLTRGGSRDLQQVRAQGTPLTPDRLETVLWEEYPVSLDGQTFEYSDDYPAVFRRDTEEGKKERAYIYEYEGSDGQALTIEEWLVRGGEASEWHVWVSETVDPGRFEILAQQGG